MGAESQCWANEQGKELVERFGAIWEDEVEKVYAFESLQLAPSRDLILDSALEYIAEAETSSLARRRWFLRLPSRRASLGCYGRILSEMNSGRLELINDKSNSQDVANGAEETSRQNLLKLLQVLSTHPKGVWSLEGELIDQSGVEDFGAEYGVHRQ